MMAKSGGLMYLLKENNVALQNIGRVMVLNFLAIKRVEAIWEKRLCKVDLRLRILQKEIRIASLSSTRTSVSYT